MCVGSGCSKSLSIKESFGLESYEIVKNPQLRELHPYWTDLIRTLLTRAYCTSGIPGGKKIEKNESQVILCV